MSATFKSCVRSLSAAGSGLALIAIATLPVSALAAEAAAQPAPAVEAAGTGANQVVVRDAVSGKLRAPTAEEAAVLQAKTSALRGRVTETTLARHHASGAHGVRLNDQFMSYSVVVRQPDGSLASQCFESREDAEAALKAQPVVQTTTAPTE
jgi:hypothetical protein